MGRIIKWLALGILVPVVLLAVLIALVVLFVDPNDYRDDIARIVKEQTGHEVVIEGDIRLSFFPWLGLDLGATRLQNREGFSEEPFAAIESAGVAVRVLPLLRREVVLDTVRLDGLRLNLEVNERGEANWEFPDDGEPTAEAPPDEPAPETNGNGMPVTLGTVSGLHVSDAHVTYDNRQEGVRQAAGPVNLRTGELGFDRDVSLTADWAAQLDETTRIQGELDSTFVVSEDLERLSLQVGGLDLLTNAEGLPDNGLETRITASLDADLAAGTANLSDLVVRSAGARLDLAAQVESLLDNPQVSGHFSIPETNLREVMEDLEQSVPETSDPDVLQRFALQGEFSASEQNLAIEALEVTLDDSQLTGSAAVPDLATGRLLFDLHGTSFNADRYLPPGSDEEGAAAEQVEAAGEGESGEEIPLEALRALNLEGTVRLDELIATGLTLSDIQVTISADEGLIRIHPLRGRLYGGEYLGDIRVDATGDRLQVTVDERLEAVQARPVMQQFVGRELVDGLLGMRLEATARGLDAMELLRELTGYADVRFTDGALLGLSLRDMVGNSYARLRDESTAEPEERRTQFSAFGGRVTIDRGRVRNDDLQLRSSLFHLDGAGEIHLFDQTVDYALTLNLVGDLDGSGGRSLEALQGLAIPVRFGGSLLSPEISLDLRSALSERQRERVSAEEERLRERAREEEEGARQELREERERLRDEAEERGRRELERLFR